MVDRLKRTFPREDETESSTTTEFSGSKDIVDPTRLNATDTSSASGIQQPTDKDVLGGRGKVVQNHVGNVRFRELVNVALEAYRHHERYQGKAAIVQAVVDTVHATGGRFLKYRRDKWIVLSPDQQRDKVGHAIRDASKFTEKSPEKRKKVTASHAKELFGVLHPTSDRNVPSYIEDLRCRLHHIEQYGEQDRDRLQQLKRRNAITAASDTVLSSGFQSFAKNSSVAVVLSDKPQYHQSLTWSTTTLLTTQEEVDGQSGDSAAPQLTHHSDSALLPLRRDSIRLERLSLRSSNTTTQSLSEDLSSSFASIFHHEKPDHQPQPGTTASTFGQPPRQDESLSFVINAHCSHVSGMSAMEQTIGTIDLSMGDHSSNSFDMGQHHDVEYVQTNTCFHQQSIHIPPIPHHVPDHFHRPFLKQQISTAVATTMDQSQLLQQQQNPSLNYNIHPPRAYSYSYHNPLLQQQQQHQVQLDLECGHLQQPDLIHPYSALFEPDTDEDDDSDP